VAAIDSQLAFLTDGGQRAAEVLERLVTFLSQAETSLDLAIYDAFLEGDTAERLLDALRAARRRGVQVRIVYNDDHRGPVAVPPPAQGVSLLARFADAVPSTAIPGVPDLMHHKYVIRDGGAVWTGSTNWTEDAWTHMENVLVTIDSPDLAAAYTTDFEQLWTKRHVEGTGRLDDVPAPLHIDGSAASVRALFAPGRGRAMGQLIATHIGQARTRIRICSPVLTSGPILASLAEALDDRRADVLVTVDGPQMTQALRQWHADGRAAWKVPLYEKVADAAGFAQKASRAYQAGPPHNYMHAKIVVCDDVTLLGSYNCSHAGELNAENLLEVRGVEFSDRCAAYCEQVNRRYRAASGAVT
jgi:phosphatidylserine/phosphatidylglycerophosphate/cardiolipin synthase-like enzyme